MEEGLSPAFERVLRERRERYNAAFAQARHRRPGLKGPVFLEHLRRRLDPIVAALPEEGRVGATDALYDLSLELVACDLFVCHPVVAAGWERLLPRVAPLLARAPRKLAASLTNALYHLDEQPGARANWWLERMLEVAVDEHLLEVGQVLAWRAGLPHYREGALELCQRLPSELTGVSPQLLEALRGDPWLTVEDPAPGPRPRVVFRVGGFRGFGGPFLAPPELRYAGQNRFYVGDGEGWWLLVVDGYGTSLHRLAAEPRGLKSEGPGAREVPELAGCSRHASGPRTVAACRELSHYVLLAAV